MLFKKAKFNNNLEGTKLIEVTTNYKGIVINYKILNSLDNELDELLNKYCESKFTGKSKFRFKGIKLEDKNSLCRFVLPVSFSHKRAYRTFSRPNYNLHHMMFQQHMQMHQQMMKPPTSSFNF